MIDQLLNEGQINANIDNFHLFNDEGTRRENIIGYLEYNSYTLNEIDICDKQKSAEAIPDNTDVIVHLAA